MAVIPSRTVRCEGETMKLKDLYQAEFSQAGRALDLSESETAGKTYPPRAAFFNRSRIASPIPSCGGTGQRTTVHPCASRDRKPA